MALTNYLAQTVICTTLMYGHGFGMFGTLDRARLWLVILPIWVVQIIASKWWMDSYAFGPVEWAWRSLTYWRIQPMKARVSSDSVLQRNAAFHGPLILEAQLPVFVEPI